MIPNKANRPLRTLPIEFASLDTVPLQAPTTHCPSCGRPMARPSIATRTPQHAPWLCTPCGRGYWNAELSIPAVKSYRPERHDWGASSMWLRKAVARERGLG